MDGLLLLITAHPDNDSRRAAVKEDLMTMRFSTIAFALAALGAAPAAAATFSSTTGALAVMAGSASAPVTLVKRGADDLVPHGGRKGEAETGHKGDGETNHQGAGEANHQGAGEANHQGAGETNHQGAGEAEHQGRGESGHHGRGEGGHGSGHD